MIIARPLLPVALQRFIKGPDSSELWDHLQTSRTPHFDWQTSSNNYLTTFLYQADADTKHVEIHGGGVFWEEVSMAQLPETDVWIAQIVLPPNSSGSYFFVKNPPAGIDYWELRKLSIRDHFGRDRIDYKPWPAADKTASQWSVYHTPDVQLEPLHDLQDEKQKGQRISTSFRSQLLENERDLFIYLPESFKPGESLPILIVFDGSSYFHGLKVPKMLDSLIARKEIPRVAALFPCSIDTPTRNRELPCNQTFVNMLASELLPFAEKSFGLYRGDRCVVAGSSFGGLAAMFAAIEMPKLFTHVISQAGAFYWSHNYDAPTSHSLLLRQIKETQVLPMRLYFDAGLRDNSYTQDGLHPHILEINRALREQLDEMGFSNYHYHEFEGGHDYACWRRTFPSALRYIFSA
jgi:enterochelin esterase family protein